MKDIEYTAETKVEICLVGADVPDFLREIEQEDLVHQAVEYDPPQVVLVVDSTAEAHHIYEQFVRFRHS